MEGDGNDLLEAEHERDEEAKEEDTSRRRHGSSLLGAVAETLHLPHMPWVSKPHHPPHGHQADHKRRASVHHDALFDHSTASVYYVDSNDPSGHGAATDLWNLIGAHFDDIEAQVRKNSRQ